MSNYGDNKIFQVAVKAIVLDQKGNILILKKSVEENSEDAVNNLYDIPGGRLNYGEGLEIALEREIMEETGLQIADVQILHSDSVIRPDKIQLIIISYKCICLKNECRLSKEHTEFFWLSLEEIIQSPVYPEWIKNIVKKLK